MPWDATSGHGFSTHAPWLPFAPESDVRSVEAQRADAGSILHFYRGLLALRRSSPALRSGSQEQLIAPEHVLAWARSHEDERREVWINFSSQAVLVPARGRVLLSSVAHSEPRELTGASTLAPHEAVILEASHAARETPTAARSPSA
jgi:glycosidase